MICPHCYLIIPDVDVARHLASKAGRKVARERGVEYFKALQAKRKVRRGGNSKPKHVKVATK